MIEDLKDRERLQRIFPAIAASPPEFRTDLFGVSTLMKIAAGSTVCAVGDQCQGLALLTRGVVRVFKLSESGREITLYRIEPGGTCVLTASCIISSQQFPALAEVEEAGEALVVPAACVRRGLESAEPWRSYIFGLVAQRLADTMAVVEEVAFNRIDERLAKLLLRRLQTRRDFPATHQQLAAELGTARVVVSRILKDFEVNGAIRLARGRIELVDPALLAAKSNEPGPV